MKIRSLTLILILSIAGASACATSDAQAEKPKADSKNDAPKAKDVLPPSQAPVLAGPAGADTVEIPPILKEIEATYAEAKSIRADFSQTKTSAKMKTQEESSGIISVYRPNKVRVETKVPDENLLVSDGKTYWFYTPPFDEGEPGELRIYDAKKVQTRFAVALLAGNFSNQKTMKIQALPEEGVFELRPRKGSGGTLEKAIMHVDVEAKRVTRVILEHQGGNRSDIQLKNVKLGEKFAKGWFTFKAPAETEIISD